MQNGSTVGRVLLASLHQAIAEVLPARLTFYERWLTSDGTAAPDLGIGSFMTMLGYLEEEGRAYDAITARAGHHAAIRSFRRLPALKRAYLRALPRRLRARKGVGLIGDILPRLHPDVRVEMTRRRGTAFIGIDGSPFCDTLHRTGQPPCGFFSGAISGILESLNLRPAVRVTRCRASGAPSCFIIVLPDQARGFVETGTAAVLGLSEELMLRSDGPQIDLPLAEAAIPPEPVSSEPESVIATPEPASAPPEPAAEQLEPVTEAEPLIPQAEPNSVLAEPAAAQPPVRFSSDEDPEAPWHRL